MVLTLAIFSIGLSLGLIVQLAFQQKYQQKGTQWRQTQALTLASDKQDALTSTPIPPESVSLYRSQVPLDAGIRQGIRPKIAEQPINRFEIVSDVDPKLASDSLHMKDVECLSPKSRAWELAKDIMYKALRDGKDKASFTITNTVTGARHCHL